MHLDHFYPIFFNQPQIASKRIHRLFNFLLSTGYVDYTPVNFFFALGTFHRADIVSRIDYVWSCPFLKRFLLTSVIFDVHDTDFSDHNPITTYYDRSFLFSSIKMALLPLTLSSCRTDNFSRLFATLSHALKSLRGLHLLKEKEFQDSSIRAHIDTHDQNFDTDISSFINSALSRSHRRIVLDRVFIDHPTAPQLLTDPKDISDAVVNHFQNAVPIKSTLLSHVLALPARWCSEYSPMDAVTPDIYEFLLSPPSLEE
ncbi:hypothetical protein RclHR1_08180016 [Rhizophagus clarus]|uniref:Uncharacterized protein n=1 Tax=Rhizophagus clarus TaxID=94130 RepID=A0A2Z6SF73_9GLOM|nr:hypothetical protein RclHR1_08180016 [Rhizophagus clarus]